MKAPNTTEPKWAAHAFHTMERADLNKVALGHQLSQEQGVFAVYTDDGSGNGYPLPMKNFEADAKLLAAAPLLAQALNEAMRIEASELFGSDYRLAINLWRRQARAALVAAGYTDDEPSA